MKILNKTKNTIVAEDAVEANNLFDKTLGLLMYAKPKSLIMKTRFGIHTFGMKYPIDLLILDKKNRVVRLKKSLKPGRIFFWNPIYNTVLELPPGVIINSKTSIKDVLEYAL